MSEKNKTAVHYRRKCHDLALELAQYKKGFDQICRANNAILAQVCKTYGEPVYDEDNLKKRSRKKKPIGWRVEIGIPTDDDLGIRVKTERHGEKYVIGAIVPMEEEKREEPKDKEGE